MRKAEIGESEGEKMKKRSENLFSKMYENFQKVR